MIGGHILTESGDFLTTEGGDHLVTEDFVADVVAIGGGFRHIGRFTRSELEEDEAVTVATSEELPVKPPSRKMRKRLAIAAKANPVEDEEEEAFMMLLAA